MSMSGGYVLIAGILLYILMIQKLDSWKIGPIRSALIVVAVYFALHSIFTGFMYQAQGVPLLPNLLSIQAVLTVVLQFIVAAIVFHKVDEDDSSSGYVLWGGLGLALLFFVIPLVTQRITLLM